MKAFPSNTHLIFVPLSNIKMYISIGFNVYLKLVINHHNMASGTCICFFSVIVRLCICTFLKLFFLGAADCYSYGNGNKMAIM